MPSRHENIDWSDPRAGVVLLLPVFYVAGFFVALPMGWLLTCYLLSIWHFFSLLLKAFLDSESDVSAGLVVLAAFTLIAWVAVPALIAIVVADGLFDKWKRLRFRNDPTCDLVAFIALVTVAVPVLLLLLAIGAVFVDFWGPALSLMLLAVGIAAYPLAKAYQWASDRLWDNYRRKKQMKMKGYSKLRVFQLPSGLEPPVVQSNASGRPPMARMSAHTIKADPPRSRVRRVVDRKSRSLQGEVIIVKAKRAVALEMPEDRTVWIFRDGKDCQVKAKDLQETDRLCLSKGPKEPIQRRVIEKITRSGQQEPPGFDIL